MIWFTSDCHFGHKSIIKHCNRPYENVKKMDDDIIRIWNKHISKDDTVYYLGDFAVGVTKKRIKSIFKKLHGKIIFIKGNHDEKIKDIGFYKVKDYLKKVIKDPTSPSEKIIIVMSHYPMLKWNNKGKGAWMLHGHAHGMINSYNEGVRRLDVGWDNFQRPISLEEIREIFLKKMKKADDA